MPPHNLHTTCPLHILLCDGAQGAFKVHRGPYMIALLNLTPIFGWYMVTHGVKNAL